MMTRTSSSKGLMLSLGVGALAGLGLACGTPSGAECQAGTLGCECIEGQCVSGYICLNGVCEAPGGTSGTDTDTDTDTGDSDDPTSGTTDDGCGDGEQLCDGQCVDVSEHPLHCGSCNNPCAEGEVCDQGACTFIEDCTQEPCPGFSYCDLNTMMCLPGCATDEQCSDNEVCEIATHECVCDEGFKLCGIVCISEDSACANDCGNDVKEGGELCDGSDLGGQTCVSQGYDGGELACAPDCTSFDYGSCFSNDCEVDYFFDLSAADAEAQNWEVLPSMLEGNDVLVWQEQSPSYAEWSIEVPCDDEWHVWVRAVDFEDQDHLRVAVDGGIEPDSHHLVDKQCSSSPNPPVYKWTELNLSDDYLECLFVEDPWVQSWETGNHTVRFSASPTTSYAISRIWVTNTNQSPP